MVTKTPSARHVSKSKKAKPFLKWAGGKSQLISQFDEYFPDELKQGKIDNYIEPFVGGGAVFFHVAQRYEISKAYLYDINQELIFWFLRSSVGTPSLGAQSRKPSHVIPAKAGIHGGGKLGFLRSHLNRR